MADKLVALLGTGKGPRVFTGRMSNLRIKIAGLNEGFVQVAHDHGIQQFSDSGEYDLPDSQWVQFNYDGKSKSLICTIRSGIHALSGA